MNPTAGSVHIVADTEARAVEIVTEEFGHLPEFAIIHVQLLTDKEAAEVLDIPATQKEKLN